MCAAPGLSAIMLPGVGVLLEPSLFMGIAVPWVLPDAQADITNVRVINDKDITFLILMIPLKS
jgi:hypothetical protein